MGNVAFGVKRAVWSLEHKVRSAESKVWSVECGA